MPREARTGALVVPVGESRACLAACRRCGSGTDRHAKFCHQCGGALPHAERHDVTVVLTDICGFTTIAERLDPEQVREILEAAFGVMLDATHRFGGSVNQFLGDGIMAIFDVADEPREHARRALEAALAIQGALTPVAEAVRAMHGLDFRVRIAVHTGPITVGAIGQDLRGDYVPMGETTSVALRLLGLARGEGVIVSGGTRTLVEDAFDFAEIESSVMNRLPAFVARARSYAWQAAG